MAGGRGKRALRRGRRDKFRSIPIALGFLLVGGSAVHAEEHVSVADLRDTSIDDLANIEVYSVSKTREPLSDAPAAIFVITHDMIVRSGATTLPEMLRLAPNLEVAQMSASGYAITARGFNSNAANKLLVLIDGRSVYTPLYGGVRWDEKYVLPEDIERIEVISGPGATLWGANATNGVINIITRKSSDTQGTSASVSYGDRERRASMQHGGTIATDLTYRFYFDGFTTPNSQTNIGTNPHDAWWRGQGGFRADWTPAGDTVTLRGNYYWGNEGDDPAAQLNIRGGNLQATWRHDLSDGGSILLLAYYDSTDAYSGNLGYWLDTYNVEVQHSFAWGDRQAIVWGAGYRLYQDRANLGIVAFVPERRTQSLSDIFVQDTIALTDAIKLTAGVKLEDDPYSGLVAMPSARLSWKASDDALVWLAYSRAARAPTRFDTDLQFTIVPSILILTGDPNFKAEKVNAYEIGTRVQPLQDVSFSISAYYNVYQDLRSVEWANMGPTLPLLWSYANNLEGHTYGLEAWANWQVTNWWQLAASLNLLHKQLRFKPGSDGLGGVASAGNDPNHQAFLRSIVDITDDITWDTDLRYIGRLPEPRISAYAELNTKIAWNVSDTVQVSLSGLNLLHAHHLEYLDAGATIGNEVDRSIFVGARWHF